METLLLMRHAKSDWHAGTGSDFDRPLSARGRAAAPRMGGWLAEQAFAPRLVVSSPARRALATAQAVLASMPPEQRPDLILDERIYEASPDELCAAIDAHGGSGDPMLIVGHNPGLELLLMRLLVPQAWPQAGKLFPTAAVYALAPGPSGQITAAGEAKLLAHMRPSMLPER
ncbi:MAG: histidine phosphatase family protein [Gammaproteobacteria bacterium]|nr:histidine phosphatase family protein [Gammaproteobacteria bacterium]